jgi:hypothetical protein
MPTSLETLFLANRLCPPSSVLGHQWIHGCIGWCNQTADMILWHWCGTDSTPQSLADFKRSTLWRKCDLMWSTYPRSWQDRSTHMSVHFHLAYPTSGTIVDDSSLTYKWRLVLGLREQNAQTWPKMMQKVEGKCNQGIWERTKGE